jgi:hypothetical protein
LQAGRIAGSRGPIPAQEHSLIFQLAPYIERFDEVSRQKFGRTYAFPALEADFREHATGKRHLTAKDMAKLFNAENTPFAKYWPRPHTKALEETLTRTRVYVGPLNDNGNALVQRLLPVFHNIGVVSLLLRFVHPHRFGIFSTPVIHLLQVTRPATVDLYLAYCDELARWREHFRLRSVAETEMALWTYAEFVKLAGSDPGATKARRQFDDDLWVQRERAAQVIRPFFRRYGRLQLAQILLDEDWIIAGKIAAEEYERLLSVASAEFLGRPLPREKGAAERLIEELEAKRYVRPEEKVELQRVWETRNKVVHPTGERPERVEVEVMIDLIQRICVPWESNLVRQTKDSQGLRRK